MAGNFRFKLIIYPEDHNLLERVYNEIMVENFSEDELDPFSQWVKMYTDPGICVCNVMVAFDKEDAEMKKILSVCVFEFFQPSNCFLLTYLVVDPSCKGKGVGVFLVMECWKEMQRVTKRINGSPHPDVVFVEVEDPSKYTEGSGGTDPADRVRMFQHMGVKFLTDFNFVQPALSEDSKPMDDLLLGAIIIPNTPHVDRQYYVPSKQLRAFVDAYYRDVYDDKFECEDYRKQMEQLDQQDKFLLRNVQLPPRKPRARAAALHSKPASSINCHVVVVGAGLAGLACAQRLQQHGFAVTVVEGRTRVGGRVYTGRTWDTRVDLGASFLHGLDNNGLHELCAALPDARLHAVNEQGSLFFGSDGKAIPVDTALKMFMQYQKLEAVVERRQAAAPVNQSLQQLVSGAWAELQAEAAQQGENTHYSTADMEMLNYLLSAIESENAASMEALSGKHYNDEEEREGGDHTVVSGFGGFSMLLSKGLNILLEHTVAKIHHLARGKGAVVEFKGEGLAPLQCDAVVVTVPLGVLQAQDITFDPPLPPWKRASINNLGNGLMNKVVLRYKSVFWPIDADWLCYNFPSAAAAAAKGKGQQDLHHKRRNCFFLNYAGALQRAEAVNQTSRSSSSSSPDAVLVALISGDLATETQHFTDQQLVDLSVQAVCAMFPSEAQAAQPADTVVYRWDKDPFAKGSYGFLRAGSTPDDNRRLALPLPLTGTAEEAAVAVPAPAKASPNKSALQQTLFFAGEATSAERLGYADGALDSGRREAERIYKQYLDSSRLSKL